MNPTNLARRLLALFWIGLAASLPAQPPDPKPFLLSNDKLELTIPLRGAKFSSLVTRDGEPLSPLASIGHFLALDGFGAASEQEQALGMPFHGEANSQLFKVVATHDSGPIHLVTMQAAFPLAQETLTRTHELTDGESVIYITSQLESGLTIDR